MTDFVEGKTLHIRSLRDNRPSFLGLIHWVDETQGLMSAGDRTFKLDQLRVQINDFEVEVICVDARFYLYYYDQGVWKIDTDQEVIFDAVDVAMPVCHEIAESDPHGRIYGLFGAHPEYVPPAVLFYNKSVYEPRHR